LVTARLFESDKCLLFRGLRKDDRRPVILKIQSGGYPRREDTARLEHEYRMASHLASPAIARPLDMGQYQGLPALILEPFPGQPLANLVGEPMEPGRFLQIAIPLAAAVADLHRVGAIHRDLKPENILVDEAAGSVKLTGLGLASLLPREHQPAKSTPLIEGTLAYMAPEQTGRMNRAIDSRSDLYSLGITFYEMLAGCLPFRSEDPLELVYCHIARLPQPPSEVTPGVPLALSNLVLKLLAKVAEERYQGATGLLRDLERCSALWTQTGRIDPFPLGQQDPPERFPIPQKLYGRERETAALLAGFERVVAAGSPELVLVSGPPGIGKSALVNELQKPIVRERGFFLAGKFDQYNRNVPYATIVQTFRGLVLEILAEPEERLAAWRQRLQAALGVNGKIITDVIPEVERVVGGQPPVPELPLAETQNRFLMVFQQFVQVFARQEHPVALFIDDLQWADAPSLRLVQYLLLHPETGYLFVIGAFRDNEVSPSHPLCLTTQELRKAGLAIQETTLGPLSLEQLSLLIGDAAHRRPDEAESLARLVLEKTAGNPFFAIQFLSMLCEERLLELAPGAAVWRWDVDEIRTKGYTDNVVELMVAKLRRFSPAGQELLKAAACLGSTTSLTRLATVLGAPTAEVEWALAEPIREGLLLRVEGTCRFLHDRVQQAAYLLIPEEQRSATHLRIGRLLRAHTPEAELQATIFDLVNQLNRGAELITDPEEREDLVRLDFLAGRKARASIAYGPARDYLAQAMALLASDAWARSYESTLELCLERSECEYLCGRFAEADALFSQILDRARSDLDRAKVYGLRQRLYQVSGKYEEATKVGIEALKLFGVGFPERDEDLPAAFEAENRAIGEHLRGRAITELADAPMVDDPRVRAALGLLADLTPCAYIGRPKIFPLVTLKTINLSLEHGNTEDSSYAFSVYAITLVSVFGDISSGVAFSEMSLRLNEKLHGTRLRGTLLHLHGDHINFWRHPIATDFPILERAFEACREVGDLVYSGFLAFETVWQVLEKGDPLDEVLAAARKFAAFAKETSNEPVLQTIRLEEQFVACLKGATSGPTSLEDASFDERACRASVEAAGFGCGIVFHDIMKQMLAFLFGDPAQALVHAEQAQKTLGAAMAMPIEATYYFFHALTLAALLPRADPERQREYSQTLMGHLRKLERWAENCPENFLSRFALVSAELARIEGRDQDARRLYEQAIESAHQNGFVQYEALAWELAAAFYRSRRASSVAQAYLEQARAGYASWGADGKVRQIDRLLPRREEPQPLTTATIAAPVERLDLLSAVRASQAISGEIFLDRLLRLLLQIMLEQGGAQRGSLLLVRDGELFLEAQAAFDEKGELSVDLSSSPAAGSPLVPAAIIGQVLHTRQRVILDNTEGLAVTFARDEYFARHLPRSVLCLPILRQARLVGLLYLENDLVAGAFTPERLTALTLLASQAAISMENALLLTRERVARQEAEAAERRAELIGEAGALLAESLDYESALARLARQCVRSLADACVLDVVEGREIRRAAGACADPAREPLLEQLRRHPPRWSSPHPSVKCLRSGRPVLFPDATEEHLRSGCEGDDHAQLVRGLGVRSLIAVPLVAHGTTLGALTLASGTAGRYGRMELELAQEVANRAALAIDNARLHRETERSLQTSQAVAAENARLMEKLREVDRHKDEFLALLGHELRNPLAALRAAVYLLHRPGLSSSRLDKARGTMERQVAHMTHLIDDMLDVSRIQYGKIQLHQQPIELAELVRHVLDDRRAELAEHGITLRLELPVDGIWLSGDPTRLAQIFENLVGNASKFTDPGGRIEVQVAREPGAWASVTVRDTGVGMDAVVISRLFRPFTQADHSLAHSRGGLGLGLPLVKGLVELHGGNVEASSDGPGRGSVFKVLLPARAAPARATELRAPAASPRRVLLIEDNADFAETLRMLLETEGHTVALASTGHDGVCQARELRPDVIMCDIGLPDIDGFAVARELRADPFARPALLAAVTGYGSDDARRRSLEAGFDIHLTKPLDSQALLRLLARQASTDNPRLEAETAPL
jgi:predicted ATPase/signal transduction histidine kinase/ActR/RegA family two-component response regulator